MLKHWDKFILMGLVIIVLVVVLRMNKVMAMQTNIMVGMAERLGMTPEAITPKIKTTSTKAQVKNNKETDTEEEEEEVDVDEEIVRIAERLYVKKLLNKKDKEFYADHKKDIDEETEFFLEDDMKRIADEIKGAKNLTQEDADLYLDNLDKFQDRLQLPNLRVLEVTIKETPKKDIVELHNEEERKHLILTFFSDGVPKNIGTLANLYAEKSGLVASTGNTAKLLDKLLEEEKLKNQKILHQSRNKVFYGLPSWFEKNKLKKEYLNKIL